MAPATVPIVAPDLVAPDLTASPRDIVRDLMVRIDEGETGNVTLVESKDQKPQPPIWPSAPSVDEFVKTLLCGFQGGTHDGGTILVSRAVDYWTIQPTGTAVLIEGPVIQPGECPSAPERSVPFFRSTKTAYLAPHRGALQWIRTATDLSDERIGRLLGVSRQTLNNWDNGESISDRNRQRLLSVREILERAVIHRKTAAELAAWLDTPRGADGRTPAQLLEAGEFDRARLLAVSVPSPGIKIVPAWVGQPIPERLRTRGEFRPSAEPPDDDTELAALMAAMEKEDEDSDE